MTLKTVDADSCIGVATVAKMFLAIDARCIFSITDMAVDTLFQAVLPATDTLMHGRVTLVEYVLHVVGAHFFNGLHAGLLFAVASLGLGDEESLRRFTCRSRISRHAWRLHAKQQAEYHGNETVFKHEPMIRG